jgi:hypothetical protein
MTTLILILAFQLLQDSTSNQSVVFSMKHVVSVPKDYTWSKVSIKTYRRSFEDGWWSCVQKYITDINYDYKNDNPWNSGGPATVGGYSDGFISADGRIKSFIKSFGKEKVQSYLAKLHIPSKYK